MKELFALFFGLMFSVSLLAAPQGMPSPKANVQYGSASGPKENVSLRNIKNSGAEVVFPVRGDDPNADVKDGQVCVFAVMPSADNSSWTEVSPSGFAIPTSRKGNSLVGELAFPDAEYVWIRVWATAVPGKCFGKVSYMWHPTYKGDSPTEQAKYPGYRMGEDGEMGFEQIIDVKARTAGPVPSGYPTLK